MSEKTSQDSNTVLTETEVKNSEKKRPDLGAVADFLSYVIMFAVFFTVMGITIYYITTAAKAEFHSDCTDTIMWANASYESGHVYDENFGYACFLPFGVNLIMQPFIPLFGVSMTTHIIGMTGFFILLMLFFFLMMIQMNWDIRYICAAGSVFLSTTLISKKMREMFWGHTIYYTLGLLFLFIGMYLFCHLFNLGAKRKKLLENGGSARSCTIRYCVTLVLLCIFILFTATDGISALTIFALPFIAAGFMEVFVNSDIPIMSKRMLYAGLRAALFLLMVLLGLLLNGLWLNGQTAGYQDAYSVYSSMNKWVANAGRIPIAWLNMLGVTNMSGKPLAKDDGIINLIYIFNAVIIAVIPLIATSFYKKYGSGIKGRMIRLWIWIHWAVTAFILLGNICGILSSANWRVLPSICTALVLSILFIMWAAEQALSITRIVMILIVPMIMVSYFSCANITNMPRDGFNDNDLYVLAQRLESEGLSYGYATFWNANAITVISGSEVKVRDVNVDDGFVTKRIYQSSEKWYEDQQGQEKYFLLLTDGEYSSLKDPKLMNECERYLRVSANGREYHIMIFDHNIV